jgi:hypothetical protein
MKTKTLVATVALAGALLAGASTAKANASLDLISGTSTVVGAVSGNDGEYFGTVGGWSVNAAFGLNSLLEVTLEDTSSGNPGHGLEVVYTSGPYIFSGAYTFGASDPGLNTLAGQASGYYSPTAIGPYTALAGSPFALPAVSSFSGQVSGSLTGTYYITEILTFGGGATSTLTGGLQTVNAQVAFKGSAVAVPDGGMTLALMGSVLAGLAGLRSKFGKN